MRTNLPEAQRKDGELPTYGSREIAERELFAIRDQSLRWLAEFARARGKDLKLEPSALQSIEDLYFEVWDGGFLSRLRGDRDKFELAMGMFWGAVAVAHHGATWSVYESPFVPNRFGVAVERKNTSVVLNGLGTRWAQRPGNKGRRGLRQLYDQIIGRD